MSTIYETTQASQEQFIDAVRQSQQAVLDAVAAWTKAVEEIAPPLPTVAGLENLPKPEVVVDNAYDFAQKLLDTQREFARNIIQAASPVAREAGEGQVRLTAVHVRTRGTLHHVASRSKAPGATCARSMCVGPPGWQHLTRSVLCGESRRGETDAP